MNRQEMLILSSPTFCLWDPTSRRDLGISWNYISFPDYRDHFLWRKWATSESGLYGIVPTEVSVLPRLHPKISKSFPAWMWWPPSPCWRPGKTCGSPTQRPLPPAGLQYWKLLDCWMEQLLKMCIFLLRYEMKIQILKNKLCHLREQVTGRKIKESRERVYHYPVLMWLFKSHWLSQF